MWVFSCLSHVPGGRQWWWAAVVVSSMLGRDRTELMLCDDAPAGGGVVLDGGLQLEPLAEVQITVSV